jgi:5-methylcytosine-specific restriction endonuclease McrA
VAAKSEESRRWREANPDHNRQWRAANREREAENHRRWVENNRELDAERKKRWIDSNPEKFTQSQKRWRKANPEKVAEIRRRADSKRRAMSRDAFVEDVPRLEIFERDGWQCQIVGCLHPGVPVSLDAGRYDPLFATVDHVIPLSKGGLHERTNLACAHLACNSAKRNRLEGIA